MRSIIQQEKECWVCKSNNVELHHIFFGQALRKISDQDGLTVFLCPLHHRGNPSGVHFNRALDIKLKIIAEKRWIEYYGKNEYSFIKRYGKSVLYLDNK